MLTTKHGKLRVWCIVLLFTAAFPMVTGCYGRFPMTKGLYRMNGDATTNKVVQSFLFWLLTLCQLYTLAMLGDAIVINLIEFWAGGRITGRSATNQDGTEFALTPGPSEEEAVLTVSCDGQVLHRTSFVRVSTSKCEVRDRAGRLLGMALRRPSGGFDLTNAEGQIVRTLSGGDVAAALAM